MKKDGHILLYTSGIDSFVGYYYLILQQGIKNPITAYVDLKNRYSIEEIGMIKRSIPSCTILQDYINLSKLEDASAFIPNRNILLFSIVSSYFEKYFDRIFLYTGSTKDERISDQTKKFFNIASKSLSISLGKQVMIRSAFDFKISKREAVNWLKEKHQIPENNIVDLTFSCLNPTKFRQPCMQCKACFRKNVSLQDITVRPFNNSNIIADYKNEIKKGIITGSRKKDIEDYLTKIGF